MFPSSPDPRRGRSKVASTGVRSRARQVPAQTALLEWVFNRVRLTFSAVIGQRAGCIARFHTPPERAAGCR
eukprot:1292266-Alexandrium_andersonii.AAC.1